MESGTVMQSGSESETTARSGFRRQRMKSGSQSSRRQPGPNDMDIKEFLHLLWSDESVPSGPRTLCQDPEAKPLADNHFNPSSSPLKQILLTQDSYTTEENHQAVISLQLKRSFECQLCHRQFDTKYKKNLHLKGHTDHRPFRRGFQCPHCERGFSRESERLMHILNQVCVKPSTLTCGSCRESFGKRQALEKHLRRSQHKKWSCLCPVCGEDFTGQRRRKIFIHVKCFHPDYIDNM